MAIDFARQADLILLVDDGGGAAQSVLEVCSSFNNRVHRIRSKDEIKAEWFDGAHKVAIIGGILVPKWSIEEIALSVRNMFPDGSTS
jgi:4-hydroxy-3-methylbut-2-en-1-yl diphosphate reductase